jgi:hypothetical protein
VGQYHPFPLFSAPKKAKKERKADERCKTIIMRFIARKNGIVTFFFYPIKMASNVCSG